MNPFSIPGLSSDACCGEQTGHLISCGDLVGRIRKTTLNQNPPLTENISSFNWPQVSFLIADSRIALSSSHPPNRLLIRTLRTAWSRDVSWLLQTYTLSICACLLNRQYTTSIHLLSLLVLADVDPDWINTKVRNIKRILHSL